MPTNLIDIHCHLDLFPNYPDVIMDCERAAIKTLTVTNSPIVWKKNKEIVSRCKHVRAALGFHPQLAYDRYNDMELFEQYFNETRYIGEIGLDGSSDYLPFMAKQIEIFSRILTLANQAENKIIFVHSRNAASKVIKLIDKHFSKGKIVFHWFSGTLQELKAAINMGAYFSINYKMLSSDKGRTLFDAIPTERILTESDGPFIYYRGKPSTPLDVEFTTHLIAQIWSIDNEQTRSRLCSNLRRLVS